MYIYPLEHRNEKENLKWFFTCWKQCDISQGSVRVPCITGLQSELEDQESSATFPVFSAKAEIIPPESEAHITIKPSSYKWPNWEQQCQMWSMSHTGKSSGGCRLSPVCFLAATEEAVFCPGVSGEISWGRTRHQEVIAPLKPHVLPHPPKWLYFSGQIVIPGQSQWIWEVWLVRGKVFHLSHSEVFCYALFIVTS